MGNEAIKRLAELITLFSRCRQNLKVKDCEECGLLHHNFADCPLKAQHKEYQVANVVNIDFEEVKRLLPTDVFKELGYTKLRTIRQRSEAER